MISRVTCIVMVTDAVFSATGKFARYLAVTFSQSLSQNSGDDRTTRNAIELTIKMLLSLLAFTVYLDHSI